MVFRTEPVIAEIKIEADQKSARDGINFARDT